MVRICVLGTALCLAGGALWQCSSEEPARAPNATVVEASGEVSLDGAPLLEGPVVLEGELVTGEGRAELTWPGAGTLRVFPRSRLRFGESAQRSQVELVLGRLWCEITELRGGRGFEVRTETAVAGVRGTEYVVDHDDERTDVRVVSGEVEVKDAEGGARRVRARERVAVKKGHRASEPERYDPEDDRGRWRELGRVLRKTEKGLRKDVERGVDSMHKGLQKILR